MAEKRKKTGKVILVGLGPGDPELVLAKAWYCLRDVDVLVVDRLAKPAMGLTKAIPEHPDKEFYDVGKEPGKPCWSQEEINALLVAKAKEGKRVVRLKGGDPFVFGRGGEEMKACAEAGIPVEVFPGLSSALAAPALAGIPLTLRGVVTEFHVLTGHLGLGGVDGPERWAKHTNLPGTMVVVMGVKAKRDICEGLISGGKSPDTPCAFIENASLPDQRVTVSTLSAMPDKAEEVGIQSPAVLIIGEVVKHRVIPKPSPRIGITFESIVPSLSFGGFNLFYSFLYNYSSKDLTQIEKDTLLSEMQRCDFTLLTSARATMALLENLKGVDCRTVGGGVFLTHRSATASGLMAFAPRMLELPTAEESIRAMRDELNGKRVLWLCGDGREVTRDALREVGADLVEIKVYERRLDPEGVERLRDALRKRELNIVVWGSPDGVKAGLGSLDANERAELCADVKHAVIGPATAQALEDLGQRADIIPEKSSFEALVDAIVEHTA